MALEVDVVLAEWFEMAMAYDVRNYHSDPSGGVLGDGD